MVVVATNAQAELGQFTYREMPDADELASLLCRPTNPKPTAIHRSCGAEGRVPASCCQMRSTTRSLLKTNQWPGATRRLGKLHQEWRLQRLKRTLCQTIMAPNLPSDYTRSVVKDPAR